MPGPPHRLVDRVPVVTREDLLAALVPPPRFVDASFDSYRPTPGEPTQQRALDAARDFAAGLAGPAPAARGRWGRRGAAPTGRAGVYFDGGFGVGKTHLLAAVWRAAPPPRAYATFVEVTGLVGALGFAAAVHALAGYRLVAIDEFELDDPGDTVLVSTLLARLSEAGVGLAATSNTQPEDLGSGRFAAADFLREIQGLAARFTVVTVDGPDFRHRGLPTPPPPLPGAAAVADWAAQRGGTVDAFPALCAHLATLHPTRYRALVADVAAVGLVDLAPVADQDVALRLVVLIDRLYDRDVSVAVSGVAASEVFPSELLAGPHRKKYLRAISRLTALARLGQAV